MEIVVFTHQARYEGQVKFAGGGQPLRLQEMLNNPAMFTAGDAIPANQIRLENVKIRFAAGPAVLHEEKPVVYVYPKTTELAYETSYSLVTRSGLATYERQHVTKAEEAHVQLLTTGQRRITGVLPHGLRTLTHPPPDRSFFALVDVELEEFHPEPLITRIHFILLNYAHVVSFIPMS
jgi:hypothetical protein